MSSEPRITTCSFSRLEDYERCQYKAYIKYALKREPVKRDDIEDKGEVARQRGIDIHEAAEQYIRGELETMPKELKKLERRFLEKRERYAENPERFSLEEEWGFTIDWTPTDWWADDVWLRVKLDCLEWLDAEKTAAEVNDVKSGKKDGNEVKHGQQGQLYTIATFMKYPDLQVVRVVFEYVDQGKTSLPKTYTREQAMAFLPMFDRRLKAMTTATTFPPKPNRINCPWCPYGPSRGDGSCEYGVEV